MSVDYRTEAIVFRSWKSKEYDRVYSIFSREHGKLRVVGVGIRKPQAKLASGLEPFTRSDVFLIKCRGLDRVKGTIVVDQYESLKNNLDFLLDGRRAVDVLEKILPDGEPNARIFDILKEYLQFIDNLTFSLKSNLGDKQGVDDVVRVVDFKDTEAKGCCDLVDSSRIKLVSKLAQLALIWKVIYWSGFFPNFNSCAYCQRKIKEKDYYNFVLSRGVHCGCQTVDMSEMRIVLGRNVIKLVKFLATQDTKIVCKLSIDPEDLEELRKFTGIFTEQIVERRVVL